MKVTLLGTSGSIATPGRAHYGGNTTSYVVEAGNGREHIIDAGSGIRLCKPKGDRMDLYFTHYHHDHMEGFPFWGEAYNPANTITAHGPVLNGVGVEQAMRNRQAGEYFPAPLEFLKGLKGFVDITNSEVFEDRSLLVLAREVNHPGGCLSYKFMDRSTGNTFVSCSDFEPSDLYDQSIIDWWSGADTVIADSQYEINGGLIDFKKDWGHSTYEHNVKMAREAGVKNLYLVHADPKASDLDLAVLEHKARTLANGDLNVGLGLEGLVLNV